MHVLFTSQGYPPTVSGVTLVVQRLARAFVDRGHRVTVLAGSERFTPYEAYDHGVHVVRVESRENPYWPASPVPSLTTEQLESLVSQYRPDVIHCHDALPFCLPLVRARHRLGRPVVATCHYYPSFVASYLTHTHLAGELIEEIAWRYSISLYNRVHEVVFATHTHRERFLAHGLSAPTRVISNGIDTRRYSPDVSDADRVWDDRLPAGRRVLAVGRLAQDKSLEILIRAMAEVRDEPAVHLLLVGEGPAEDGLRRLARDSDTADRVHFLGFVPEDDLPSLYRASDAFAISSNHEVQSLPALQAAATGLPIIAAAQGSLPEICRDGENGILVHSESPAAYAAALRAALIPAVRAQMGEASLALSRAHDEHATFDSYERLYLDATQGLRPAQEPQPAATAV